jgi:HK97 family phage prohead protease
MAGAKQTGGYNQMSKREFRAVVPELRAAEDNPSKLVGYCATFDSPTQIGSYFTEVISPGAFTETIAADDIVALVNHDENLVLGRNTASTLLLREDTRGLYFEIDLPDTQAARDLAVSVQRRDISGCSFAFAAIEEIWDYDTDTRTLQKVKLFDVSIVTNPAYSNTSVSARSAQDVLEEFRSKKPAPDAEPPVTGIDLTPLTQYIEVLRNW